MIYLLGEEVSSSSAELWVVRLNPSRVHSKWQFKKKLLIRRNLNVSFFTSIYKLCEQSTNKSLINSVNPDPGFSRFIRKTLRPTCCVVRVNTAKTNPAITFTVPAL
jgi:hypothetical protein